MGGEPPVVALESECRERLKCFAVAAFQVTARGPQIALGLLVEIKPERLAQFAELRPRNDHLLRLAPLVHDDFLSNCRHGETILANCHRDNRSNGMLGGLSEETAFSCARHLSPHPVRRGRVRVGAVA